MKAQQFTITHTTNAIISIKKSIGQLSKDVSNDFECREVQHMYFEIIDCIKDALLIVNQISVDPSAIICLDRSLEMLSTELSDQITKQQIEDTNDDVIGFLNVVLSRLGYNRYSS